MAIKYRPRPGTILLCDFQGAIPPEMNKKRPVIVLSSVSDGLCIVAPMSTTPPIIKQKWHYLLHTPDTLHPPYDAKKHWVKCDMVGTVSFDRLYLPRLGKNAERKRIYDIKTVSAEDLRYIIDCVMAAIEPDIDNISIAGHK